MTGVRITVGSHLDGPRLTQCPRCDRHQHRRCIRYLKSCAARKAPTPKLGVSSRDAAPPTPEELETDWQPIDGVWAAIATDGVGHHDGDGEYLLQIPVEHFGELLLLGGDARFEANGADPHNIFRLPSVAPTVCVNFRFRVCAEGRTGRVVLINGIEVRARQDDARDADAEMDEEAPMDAWFSRLPPPARDGGGGGGFGGGGGLVA